MEKAQSFSHLSQNEKEFIFLIMTQFFLKSGRFKNTQDILIQINSWLFNLIYKNADKLFKNSLDDLEIECNKIKANLELYFELSDEVEADITFEYDAKH